MSARRILVTGVVQGVGFRPHVLSIARALGLAGTCRNDATSVIIDIEGESDLMDRFRGLLVDHAPPLARILSVEEAPATPSGATDFTIVESTAATGARTLVPPDTAVCADCLTEMNDPDDRRFRHPFITCTHCGPRFTITLDLPYDRPVTTMAGFELCTSCAQEYADPEDRRHHAQPIACHDCGPRLSLTAADGTVLATGAEDSIRAAVAALRAGAILAIKGIGGYHLACDATSCTAATVLRSRKQRPDQPFAVMVRDLATAESLVEVGSAAPILTGPERPIVILPARPNAPVAACVAPGLDELGVLLAYAPVHHLLFADLPDGSPGAPEALVMTSGNLSGEPLCFQDADALVRLGRIADVFLVHDREIAVPCEDSVVAWDAGALEGDPIPVRRSRGYAPLPVGLGGSATQTVMAAGAEVKNTFALARDGLAFVSAHLGDLGTLESRISHQRATAQLLRFHRSSPDLVVADRHPGYASRAWAKQFAQDLGVPLLDVQHHHAHLAALAAEHGRMDEPILGVVFDGTGYGCDASIWGGEFLLLGSGGTTATRVGHLGPVRLPGGDEGVRNPVRTAALAMLSAGAELAGTPVDACLSDLERSMLPGLLRTGVGVETTSSVGRLFDVVSAMLGVRARTTYEAQAAIELEAAARRWRTAHPHASVPDLPLPQTTATTGLPSLDPDPLVRELALRQRAGAEAGELAYAFHVALAAAATELAVDLARGAGASVIGLTGGVFGNRLLLGVMRAMIGEAGLEPLLHRVVPANDGGLSLGQVAIGVRTLGNGGN
ncbi:carbamoyltransferase HypF [Nocardioides salsibiostraticola]